MLFQGLVQRVGAGDAIDAVLHDPLARLVLRGGFDKLLELRGQVIVAEQAAGLRIDEDARSHLRILIEAHRRVGEHRLHHRHAGALAPGEDEAGFGAHKGVVQLFVGDVFADFKTVANAEGSGLAEQGIPVAAALALADEQNSIVARKLAQTPRKARGGACTWRNSPA